ncbi:nickel pincer cofactor biosynthesis protein LarB [Calderihabitans maritimus]|uniref:1-(5-phosphoribosyl)-5-amino-4-imidazole-carboxylate carboxylase n=1 Tax=Calderihabitans maritimus TaxID=1246530 RepID=A0A1Z5HNB9_9FIRM|nr:nickel pincer cofactor biosynthesis protein LarB [Calderihabitans maritimus]GAW91019.1 1-(5-phosphoribosyl)-5-amino-4-imidazole-carboxylate carboxylase [Calderihabitans maritimus]
MDGEQLKTLLQQVREGKISVEQACEKIRVMPYQDLGFAKIDHHRAIRQGFPEVVYCEGKTVEQIITIIEQLNQRTDSNILATRMIPQVAEKVLAKIPQAEYHELARMMVIQKGKQKRVGNVLVMSAGTSDLPVAEEAALTAEAMGSRVERLYDVGVAGIHRLLLNHKQLFAARVIVVVAGMEGALASVVGGLVDKPVIAVPTSVGYGASFKGLAALLTMLNSCASGVAVVNIDNGFGAGYTAALINRIGEKEE